MTRRFLVTGRVQGVGFRYYVVRQARRLGLVGWVRNLPDGSVEAVAAGESEALDRLEASLRVGPGSARVGRVDVSEISDEVDLPSTFAIMS